MNDSERKENATKPADFYETDHYDAVDYNIVDGVDISNRKSCDAYGEIQLN